VENIINKINVEENNKLIANFMEYPYFLSDSGVDSWGDDDVERWEVGFDDYCKVDELKFNSSWNWLMEVVDRIEKLGYDTLISKGYAISNYGTYYVEIGRDFYMDEENKEVILSFLTNSKIESTYLAVRTFIKWYNGKKERGEL